MARLKLIAVLLVLLGLAFGLPAPTSLGVSKAQAGPGCGSGCN